MSEPSQAAAEAAETGGATNAVRVSVVIPTFRRPTSLARCLERLSGEQPPFPWEVLVVDHDPAGTAADDVIAIAERWHTGRPDVPIRRMVEAQSGAAHARNRGIA